MPPGFTLEKFLKHFDKYAGGDITIEPARLLAFRTPTAPVRFIIADSLRGWHDPDKVNTILKSVGAPKDYFSKLDTTQ